MNILQQIFNDHFDTVANSGISIRDTVFDNVNKMLLSVTLNMALLSTVANIAVTLSLSPLDAKAVFVLLAVISILSNALPLCLLNLFVLLTAIVFLPFPNNFVSFSAKTVLSLIVFFVLFLIAFSICSER